MILKFGIQTVGTRTERLWTIQILNLFGIRAPTVFLKRSSLPKFVYFSDWRGHCPDHENAQVIDSQSSDHRALQSAQVPGQTSRSKETNRVAHWPGLHGTGQGEPEPVQLRRLSKNNEKKLLTLKRSKTSNAKTEKKSHRQMFNREEVTQIWEVKKD